MGEYIEVLTTASQKEDADRIAKELIEKGLAACVQVLGPIISHYKWKDRVECATEWLCIIKTRSELYDELERAIKEVHPYETPEIIVTPIINGSNEYFAWMDEALEH